MSKNLYKLLAFLLALGAAIFFYAKSTGNLTLPLPKSFQASQVVEQVTSTTLPVLQVTTSTHITNATVVRVVDGDTIIAKLDNEPKDFTIRLLGINTPEVVDPRKPVECFGREASDHAKHILLPGMRIDLEADPAADERDKYNRLLRNIILADGTDFNAQSVAEGYAYALTSFPLTPARKRELNKLQEDARLATRGLWSPTTCKGQKTL